jgi:hypothetical protein
MFFLIIKSLSPADGDEWTDYCEWRAMDFERFDSIDKYMRPSLLPACGSNELNADDWSHLAITDGFFIDLINDFDYAVRKFREIGKGNLVGVCFDGHDESHPGFRGYDLIDCASRISLLTDFAADGFRQ